jgi:predicted nucleic acid-binding protein
MIAIIDTSALITLYMIDKVKNLNTMFSEVYVPLMVEKEFLKDDTNNRLSFLLNFYEENYWFKKCQTYQNDIIEILLTNKKIDDGEREAIAQYKRIQIDLAIEEGNISCVIDEREARKVAQNMDIKVNGTLYLLAKLHFEGFLDYSNETNLLKKGRRYSEKVIVDAFEKVKFELGLG